MKVAGSYVAVPILYCVLALFSSGCNETIGKVMSRYGFTELRPPSDLLSPGTIITISDADPLTADIVCTQEASLGPDPLLQASEKTEREVAAQTKTSFNISEDWLTTIRANAKYSAVEHITLTLTNVLVREVSEDTVFDRTTNRSAECVEAMESRVRNGQIVSMIRSIVGADVVYKVDFRSEADLYVSGKESLIKSLAKDLGADASTATSETVEGKGLFWGVHDDTWLARIQSGSTFSVLLTKETKSRDFVKETLARERLLNPGQVVTKINVNP